ncbi:MAG: helix-turn-helix domain-containing protein [Rhizobacter sp.]|nr:helix-turn-helix domain-containing protein [Chlorobiales bacterium]
MTIKNDTQLAAAFRKLDAIIASGFEGNKKKEASFDTLTEAISDYEKAKGYNDFSDAPKTIGEMLGRKMFERKINQKELAMLLDVPPTRISEVLKDKRRLTFGLAKKIHRRLGVSAEFILNKA